MKNLLYPDSGSRLEDASVLRNAVYFSTAERSYSANLILEQNLGVQKMVLRFLVIKAFEEFMTTTEDMVGWLFALKEWQPGNAKFSLFLLLDRIQVGRGGYEEERAVSILSNTNDESFRELLHIPKDEDLIESGVSKKMVDSINRGIHFKREGWLKIAKRRRDEERGWVRMFNKLKHHMLAFPTRSRNKEEVWLPADVDYDEDNNRIKLESGWLEVSANEVRELANDTIAAQAVLHDTLALILSIRYSEEYVPQKWVIYAKQTMESGLSEDNNEAKKRPEVEKGEGGG
jgi:hypothetical protein